MKTINHQLNIDYKSLSKKYLTDESIFFDIETTGFSTKTTFVYLIGCVYLQNNNLISKQWFAEDPSEEPLLLNDFFNTLNQYKTIIHFNGSGFDIPYIEEKCKNYSLPYSFATFESLDIYKKIQKLKKVLKVDNLKQKTIEDFMDFNRKDVFSGGELIDVYYSFLKSKEDILLKQLLLHNYDDIRGMVSIMDVLAYSDLFQGDFSVSKIKEHIEKPEIDFEMNLHYPLPKRITHGYGPYYLNGQGTTAHLKIRLHTDELKYFYPNYKDYYYLPIEDKSIHKSVAFYVDKDYRTKAKAANCYSKKTGKFLPQYKEIIMPYFKIDYHDKITYFETTNDFLESENEIKRYLIHVLQTLL